MPASEIIRHPAFHSTWLDRAPEITIYQPAARAALTRGLPCLILHDGQNLFDPERAYAGRTWRVAETADQLIDAGRIPPLLIVGVDHAGPDRVREYTPTPGRDHHGGFADRHARFLVDELLPFLWKTYGVTHDPAGLGLGGSSLGGLATLFVASVAPGQFGRLLAMSPSIWWDRRAILRQLRQHPLAHDTRVWIDAGAREGAKTMRNVRDVRHLLQRQDPRVQVRYMMDPDGEHNEDSWARRFGDALRFLYDDWG